MEVAIDGGARAVADNLVVDNLPESLSGNLPAVDSLGWRRSLGFTSARKTRIYTFLN
jgi:hypothetical protein